MENFLLKLALPELISRANKIRKEFIGSKLELCSIMNAKSGLCSEDCKFCAQSSRHKADIFTPLEKVTGKKGGRNKAHPLRESSLTGFTYPLKDKDEIIKAAENAKKIGAERFGIVTSGNHLEKSELNIIAQAISEIKDKVAITVCASLGALSKNELNLLKEVGLSRYHHNIETSPRFYPQVVSTHSFQTRVNTIKAAKEVGLEVCSGVIIGMGETWQDRIDMAYLLKELDVDSIPINLLIPIKGTPFESMDLIPCNDAIKTIGIFRIILKDKIIKIAAGRETILKDFQALAFMSGANGMLIGGYLTIKGRAVEEDHKFIKEIKRLWAS